MGFRGHGTLCPREVCRTGVCSSRWTGRFQTVVSLLSFAVIPFEAAEPLVVERRGKISDLLLSSHHHTIIRNVDYRHCHLVFCRANRSGSATRRLSLTTSLNSRNFRDKRGVARKRAHSCRCAERAVWGGSSTVMARQAGLSLMWISLRAGVEGPCYWLEECLLQPARQTQGPRPSLGGR